MASRGGGGLWGWGGASPALSGDGGARWGGAPDVGRNAVVRGRTHRVQQWPEGCPRRNLEPGKRVFADVIKGLKMRWSWDIGVALNPVTGLQGLTSGN